MRVNLYIFSVIVVDTWCVVKGILVSRLNYSEDHFCTKLAEEMIDNKMDEDQRTRGWTSNLRDTNWGILFLDKHDKRVSSGFGVHLTPTNKQINNKVYCTNYMQQDWCSDCKGFKKFKSTYVCSMCRDDEGKTRNVTFCHPKTGRLCFRYRVEKEHPQD